MIATHLHEAILKADRQNLPSFDAPATRYARICEAVELDFCRLLTEDEKAYIWRMVCPVSQQAAEEAGEGRKNDDGKAPFDLLAPEFLWSVSEVLAHGAAKYERRNWEKGMRWGRVFAAAMRHLWAWWKGEKLDPETGLPHLAHAACCVMFLHAYEERGIGEDDRWKN